jgi:diaminohydroxyphosphoribosylaminopyrimidine deaminase/5-amino-6-(5-phosphoribosylamino)uracil reductase
VNRPDNPVDRDRELMATALATAAAADHRASPNPTVGAVLAGPGGGLLAAAASQPVGGPHAEVEVVRLAAGRTRGATLYVTLEPCDHQGRTPPCTGAIVAAGITRVVVAMEDPNPVVSGRGVQRLREAGLTVEVGLAAGAAQQLHRMYLMWARRARPFVTLKFAASLDGRVASANGDSRWITSPAARHHAHLLRRRHDAILVGIGTILADDPELTTRLPDPAETRQPLRVVLDSRLRTPPGARVLRPAAGGARATVIATAPDPDPGRLRVLESAGAEVLPVLQKNGRVDLVVLLAVLGGRGISSLLVEGGPTVHGAFRDAGLGDGVVALLAPRLLGGTASPAAVGGHGAATLAEAPVLVDVEVARAGVDVVVSGYSEVRQEDRSG